MDCYLPYKNEVSPENLIKRAPFLNQHLQRLYCRRRNTFPGLFLMVSLTERLLGLSWVLFSKRSLWTMWSLVLQSWEGRWCAESPAGQPELLSYSANKEENYDLASWDFLGLSFPSNQCFTNMFWTWDSSGMFVYIRVHSWCCAFSGFWGTYNDMYPPLQLHNTLFWYLKNHLCSACSSIPPPNPWQPLIFLLFL